MAVLAGYIGYFGLLPTGPATLIVRETRERALAAAALLACTSAPHADAALRFCRPQAPTVVYLLVWLMFWGIVSHKMNAEVKSFLITLPGVWVFMWWMDALLPYCIGWIAVCAQPLPLCRTRTRPV